MTELYRFTIDVLTGEREMPHECFVKANDLKTATDTATDYASTFFQPAVQEEGENGSIYWRTPDGDIQWEVGMITQVECISISPISAPVIYLPQPVPRTVES